MVCESTGAASLRIAVIAVPLVAVNPIVPVGSANEAPLANTNAVVAICVVLVPFAAVGAGSSATGDCVRKACRYQ